MIPLPGMRNWQVAFFNALVTPLSLSDQAKNNLVLAKQTVQHVKSHMTLGAGNRLGDLVMSVGMSAVCVIGMRSVTDDYDSASTLNMIRLWAEAAKGTGCGNCGEQAALAFIHLYDLGVRPLDYMYVSNGDHAFVLIGRNGTTPAHDVARWGPHAIVCDAWDARAYPAADIHAQQGRTTTFDSMHREG